ncbi:heavy metal translocating P-type ATPase [Cupriavidus gilardii]|uniref:heavy metal translocating P-type ATPase n=1 Tax=Cupriavidus gilardii TaxID=82541 RepID=UPI001EE591AD|nr:heavy metal translocating P-type ATPase [Cupriavidus gilardii]MCG5263378.1 heavy metal translocating P-type ATPase [Cupriavidus gilardii]MDF9431769.1 heavy metal translocating P-type ATPase [Cupriavidus gilardii]
MPIAFAPSSPADPCAPARHTTATATATVAEAVVCFHCALPASATETLRAAVGGVERRFCCAGCLALAQALDRAGFAHLYAGEFRFGRPLDDAARARLEPVWQAYDTEELRARFVRRLDGARAQGPEERSEERFEITLAPENIRCAACTWLIEQKLAQLPGVESAVANLATRRVLVRWRGNALTVAGLLGALADIGYTAWPFEFSAADRQDSVARRGLLMRLAVAMLGMMQVMMYAWPVYMHEGSIAAAHLRLLQWASLALTLPVIVYSAAPIFAGAWRSLRRRHVGMDVPVALGLAAAFGASLLATVRGTGEVYYDSVTMFVALLLLARYLELRVRQASRSGAETLARQLPATCERLLPDGTPRRVPVARLMPGDRVRVRAGEIVPADGEILEGRSDLDESMLSGESRPVPRGPGQPVLAGCYNASSPLVIEVRQVGAGTRLAEIVALLERALADKPRLAVVADRVAAWFVAALLVIAAAVGLLWWLVAPEGALMVTVAVLVVSCPCALSLATPAALAAAGAALSRRGMLLTRGHALETLAGVTDVVLDKTGTLTEGRFAVANVIALGDLAQADCLTLAGALCRSGEHPVARALVAAADRAAQPSAAGGEGIAGMDVAQRLSGLRNRPGQGVEAMLDGRPIRVGRRDFVDTLAPAERAVDAAAALEALRGHLHEGASPVWLGDERGPLAVFVLSDTERAQAADLLARLRTLGLRCHLISGDSQPTVRWWARHFGIDDAQGRVSPEGKRDYVAALQRDGAVVLAIGDGINDAPVLAQAQVSLALASGAPLAQVGADAVLTHDGIAEIAAALAIARRARAVIRQNLGWAFAYNLVAIPLAASGHLTAWMAGLGMSLSSLLVVANAWRLLRLPKGR